ncbi:hypothetical protein HAX54_048572 [Datura stramonium]|uniref:Uncharacterized protein n=1 Tax=Datura stramonium TaxID=4076 RepID=A0ABS8WLJ1_DATST|nr:hypothetical protein [Datura stramonium]
MVSRSYPTWLEQSSHQQKHVGRIQFEGYNNRIIVMKHDGARLVFAPVCKIMVMKHDGSAFYNKLSLFCVSRDN